MTIANFRSSLAVWCFPLLAAPAGLALAHTQDGSLADGAAATDYYQVTCSDDGSGVPASLLFQIQNRGPAAGPVVSALVQRGTRATSSSDLTAGDAMPPLVFVNGSDGVYNVFVIKSAAGVLNYTLIYHCMTGANGGGIHTGTTIVTKQRSFPPG